jgi:two-component system, NtrC family, nitrogen regulation sensor histidine kinase NtrY
MGKLKPFTLFVFSIVLVLASVGWEIANDNSAESAAREISVNLEKTFGSLNVEASRIINSPEKINWSLLKGSHFLVDSLNIIAWSSQAFLPDIKLMQDSFTVKLVQASNGDFLIQKLQLNKSKYIISVLPLYIKYPIVNKYLSAHLNRDVFEDYSGKIEAPGSSLGINIDLNNISVFRFVISESSVLQSQVSFFLTVSALIIFLIALFLIFKQWHYQRNFQLVFLVATGVFLVVRTVMVLGNFPGRWYTARMFSPQEFASSAYNASIGDLFINSLGILFICGYVFLTYSQWPIIRRLLNTRETVRWGWCILFILCAIFSFLYPFLFIEVIYHNSSISLDITQTLSFDLLRVLSFISMIFGVISAFFFTHVFIQLSKALSGAFWKYAVALSLACAVFIAYFLVESRDYWITLMVVVPYIVILYFSRLNSSLTRITYVTFLYLFLAVTAFGLQSALSIKRFVEEERVDSQFKFANSYLVDRDVLAEYLLNESVMKIPNDVFIQTRLASPFLSKSPIRQKVKQIYLNSYFDRYEVQVNLYNASKEPFDDQTMVDFVSLEEILSKPINATEYQGINFIRSQGVQTGKRYVAMIPITRFEQVIGYVALDLSLKRVIPQNVYPELLVDNRFNEYFENRDKSFAFLSANKIVSSFGNFNYDRDFDFELLDNSDFYEVGVKKNGFIHTGVNDDSGRVAIVTSIAYPAFFLLTNFSVFFVTGIWVFVFGLIIYGLAVWMRGGVINYAARIQLYIYLAFAIPLVIVTVTTLNRVTKSAENQLNQVFQTKSKLLGENLELVLASFLKDPDNMRSELENQLVNVAKFSNVDVSIYNPSGKVLASSQPAIVENQLSSSLMNRVAWERIFKDGENTLILNEQIGSLRFNNSYYALKSPDSGVLIGVLSVPFFESAISLEGTRINVLANILTVFTVIFILFSVLSFFMVNTLTFPLRFITRTLSRTTLTGTNEPLKWNSNDEIGLMVTEYNRMLKNLEQSKVELARSQKESAWREIAKQVAHEIKNPLTPMKLTLQQMELAYLQGELEKEKAKQSIKTLLSQVDILNEIASSFSAFARMPAPILQKVELVGLIRKSADLYSDYETGTVSFQYNGPPVFVNGDEQLLSRIFSNIMLNALQSGMGQQVHVHVEIKREPNQIQISFRDNGQGIDEDLKNKIFAPYFSTKKSGSGLGLAIAKQGIEQSGGEIWFESNQGAGTTFYIRLVTIE